LNILDDLYQIIARGQSHDKAAHEEILAALRRIDVKQDQILSILNESPPITGAEIVFGNDNYNDNDKENNTNTMSSLTKQTNKPKGKLKFVLADNGTATGTISFVDAVGAPTSPAPGATVATTLTSSSPAIGFTVDPTGLIVTATPVTPPVLPLATNVVVTASVTVTNTDGSVLGPFTCDNSADPMNVTATGPTGASIAFA
jgi:hypothetical protein